MEENKRAAKKKYIISIRFKIIWLKVSAAAAAAAAAGGDCN